MLRRMLSAGACALALGGAIALDAGHVQAQSRPNIILIMVDDMSVGTLATMVSKGLLPNVKAQFVDKGFTFTESFVTRALGVPSRATSLTGLYAHNHGVLGHANETNGGISRFNASSTVATWLRTSGYRTGYAGKYLAGYGTWTAPTYIPPGWDSWLGTLEPNYHSMYDYSVNFNGTVVDFGPINQASGNAYYQTDLIAAQAGSFIAASPLNKPFFLYVAPAAINMEFPFINECAEASAPEWGGNFWGATGRPAARHLNTIYGNTTDFPLPQTPSFNEDDVSDKPDWMQGNPQLTLDDVSCLQKNYWRRLEMLRSLDDLVGYVFQSLQAKGVLSNTVALLTSDNGLYYGQHRLGEKSSAFEESIRVPLLVRAPWRSTPVAVNKIVLNNDLAPTIASLALVTPWLAPDGRSFLPILQNPASSAPWRTGFLVEHWSENAATVTSAPDLFAVRTEPALPRLFTVYPTATSGVLAELYDLSTDPNELENVVNAPSRADEVSRLTFWIGLLTTCRALGCQVVENYVSALAH